MPFEKNTLNPLVVIGNGPSLRGFDFWALKHCDTIGMNAAYRFWDRIGWYPTYYCCLDTELIVTHHAAIYRLVTEGLVKGAYVAGNFFDFYPDAAKDERFLSYDQVSRYWYNQRGYKTGRPFIQDPAFETMDSSKLTTGAASVRYGAYLGYREIGLIGIDLKYVEILPEAQHGEGVSLIMQETPKHNPNYFFDDYQQAGDRYNIPNPEEHKGQLHIDSFKVLRDDFAMRRLECNIFNCNENSGLMDQAIFPYCDITRFTTETKLRTIAVPCVPGEVDQIITNLKWWAQPSAAPFLGRIPERRPKLAFVFNKEIDEASKNLINEAVDKYGIRGMFSDVELRVVGLEGEQDAYVRSYDRPAGREGYKAGPNNQFFETMQMFSEEGGYTFLMETDCVPIRPDWLRSICRIVDHAEPFWIMGSAYRGTAPLSRMFCRHINGNAVYATGDPSFMQFVESFWRRVLDEFIESKDRRMAYDCALESAFGEGRSDVADDPKWRQWQACAHKIRYTDFIQNISGSTDVDNPSKTMVQDLLAAHPHTLIVHNQRIAKAVESLLASQEEAVPINIRPKPKGATEEDQPEFQGFHFVSVYPSAKVERTEHWYILPQGAAHNHVACKYVGIVRPGDNLRGRFTIEVDRACRLSVSLCRDGGSPFEQNRTVLDLNAGEHSNILEHCFKMSHRGVRIQFGAEHCDVAVRVVETAIEQIE